MTIGDIRLSVGDIYLSDSVYLKCETSSACEICSECAYKLDKREGGAISGDIDIVNANLSIDTFDNIYDVADKQTLSEKLHSK